MGNSMIIRFEEHLRHFNFKQITDELLMSYLTDINKIVNNEKVFNESLATYSKLLGVLTTAYTISKRNKKPYKAIMTCDTDEKDSVRFIFAIENDKLVVASNDGKKYIILKDSKDYFLYSTRDTYPIPKYVMSHTWFEKIYKSCTT